MDSLMKEKWKIKGNCSNQCWYFIYFRQHWRCRWCYIWWFDLINCMWKCHELQFIFDWYSKTVVLGLQGRVANEQNFVYQLVAILRTSHISKHRSYMQPAIYRIFAAISERAASLLSCPPHQVGLAMVLGRGFVKLSSFNVTSRTERYTLTWNKRGVIGKPMLWKRTLLL